MMIIYSTFPIRRPANNATAEEIEYIEAENKCAIAVNRITANKKFTDAEYAKLEEELETAIEYIDKVVQERRKLGLPIRGENSGYNK